MREIEQSKICIHIFSKNYASSKWCLREVAEIMKLKDETKHVIISIFLDITPDEVKYQTGSYAKAFTQHEKNYDFETVQEWRNALQEVVKLKGFELKKEANGNEGKFIKKVLVRVLNCLKKPYLGVTDILVGVDDHVEAVKTLLELGKEGVQIVGIWGMGGIGKTTLAKVVYNQLLEKFESSCFLNDIRETSSQHKGLQYLQSKLLSDILNCKCEDFANTNEGTQELKNRLRGKKAIILLDDVDQVDQLKALAGDLAWFSPESRIIVTTREKTVLDLFRIKNIYEHTLLSEYQAFRLFCKHAFITGLPTPDFVYLSWDIVRTTGGHPLTLEVIGSSLSLENGRKDIWQGALEKLKKIPPSNVQEKLRLSYNGLDQEQQEIFLNIACSFIGTDARIACEISPKVGIEILLFKSLIRITDNGKLWMHDLLRDLGREIRMTKVEAISLEGYQFRSEDLCFKDDQFKNLPILRILLLDKANLSGNFERILLNLRWLSWHFCNFSPTLPTNLNLKNLIVLDLSRSMVSEDWAGWSLMKLKVLDLTECNHLTRTPGFSEFPALERLILRNCRNLVSVDPSIELLSALVSIDIRDCTKLEHLPQLGSMDALTELLVDGTSIQELPILRGTDKLGNLEALGAN
ncbi:TMV resistance protein N-like [Punica granatum]|uniref:TMV resistance protein N-like n=1 Tax=Punica granatum TaxID=22663 RepID=A0A6P8C4M8_PUNGR|nr:TMV resistance protein N-like [Punica granatum]